MSIKRPPFLFWFSIINSILGGTNLESCREYASDSPNSCLSCSDDYFSLWESAFKTDQFPTDKCVSKNSSVLELELFVSEKECIKSSPCDGSLEYPFDNFVFALDFIHNTTIMYYQAKVNLYLLGEQIFVLQKDLETARKYYFRHSLINLKISPFPCDIKKIYGCKGESELFKINIKTNRILIFISGALYIRNLIINGVDMPLEKANSPSSTSLASSSLSCQQKKIICCTKDNNAWPISGDDFSIDCKLVLNQTGILVNKAYLLGLFNSEYWPHVKNTLIPKITIENCKFEGISTSFVTNSPRFASLIQILGNLINLTLKDVLVNECSFVDGLLKQVAVISELNFDEISKPSLKVINVSISDIKAVLLEWRKRNSIILIANFDGEISVSEICLKETKDTSLLFLDFSLLQSRVEILNANFIKNEGVGFLICQQCSTLKVEGSVFRSSLINMAESISLFVVKYSKEFFLYRIVIEDFSFLQRRGIDISRSLIVMNDVTNIDISDFFSQRVINLGFSVESLVLVMRKLIVLEMSNDYRFISARKSSVIFEEAFFSLIEMNFEFLITMESDIMGADYALRVNDAHFSNITFFEDTNSNGVFEWPLYTLSDVASMKNITVFNITNDKLWNDVYFYFFMAYGFARLEFEYVEFSYHKEGCKSLLYLDDFTIAKLNNIKFRNNEGLDYYLISLYSFDSQIYLKNVELSRVSFTDSCFFFRGRIGVFENFTFTDISGIHPSPSDEYPYIFYNGLIIFKLFQYCLLRNWHFESSEVFEYTPSRIFRIFNNSNALLNNISVYISEGNSDPEIHILACLFTELITIQNFNAKNFFCQRSILGNTFYEGGVISFFNSRTFLKDSYSSAQVYIINLSIENCKFCNNGAVSFVNIGIVYLNNISVTRSENINGGSIAIFYGAAILIENVIAKNTSALQYGGAFLLIGTNSLIIKNAYLRRNRAQFGGALYLKYLYNLTLIDFICEDCEASFDGGVIYSLTSNININKGSVTYYLASKDGGFAFFKRGKFHMAGGFQANFGLAQKGGFLFALEAEEIFFQDISVSNNSAMEKGIFLLLEESSQLLVNNITLVDLISDSGFGCMFLYTKSISASYYIQNILCFKIICSTILVYLQSELDSKKNFNLTVRNIVITICKGSVMYFESANYHLVHMTLLENILVSEVNNLLLLSKNVDKTLKEQPLFTFESGNLFVKNLTLKSIGFSLQCLFFLNSVISIDFLLFQNNYVPPSDSEIFSVIYASQTTAKILRISFLGEPKSNILLILSENSILILKNGTISKCNAISTSCIDIYKSQIQLSSLIFYGNRGFTSGVLSAWNSTIMIDYCDFNSNRAISREIRISINTAVNDISIFGKLEASLLIRFCSFLETSSGTSVVAVGSSLIISYCKFIASSLFSSTVAFKAIWSSSSDIEILFSNFSNFISENGGTLKIEHQPSIKHNPKIFSLQYSIIEILPLTSEALLVSLVS